jgi:hypothetical protein
MLALFPYYAKNAGSTQNPEEASNLKKELEQARKELEQIKLKDPKSADSSEQLVKENSDLKQQLAEAREKLQKNPSDTKPGKEGEGRLKKIAASAGSVLFITAFWENPNADVDLWVKNSASNWEGPKKETPDGKRLINQISDQRQGPGYEEFHQPGAGGKYEVFFRYSSQAGNAGPVLVRSRVSWLGFDEKGSGVSSWWNQTRLNEDRRLIPAFIVTFNNGKLNVQPTSSSR